MCEKTNRSAHQGEVTPIVGQHLTLEVQFKGRLVFVFCSSLFKDKSGLFYFNVKGGGGTGIH
ncbi:hypothetical protein J2TS4_38560 [Paenibacillus sp. J2TS4]|nr:hypothetical protein J2TS4_38560 [Paenibacillus sp. J2TS4]